MIRRLAGIALVALSGCGGQAGDPAPGNSSVDRATPAPLSATISAQPGTGSGLRADVSGLSADASGLAVRVTDLGTVVALAADTLFAFDSAELGADAAANLGKLADLIRAGGPGTVAIVGHTDAKGDDAYNLKLSERRAAAVAAWMGGQVGVRQRPFAVSGRGEAEPVAPNAKPDGSDDPDGRARNRRVEVTIPRAG